MYKNRKIQIFLVFLVAAFLAWLVSNMSETYTDEATFQLRYDNIPDSLFLTGASQQSVAARLQTTGFKFLAIGWKDLEVGVDLSKLGRRDSVYYMAPAQYHRQIEGQLSDNISLLGIDNDTLFFNFVKVYEKEVPVTSSLVIRPAQDYLVEDPLRIAPERITVRGPRKEIDTIYSVYTEKEVLEDLADDFKLEVALIKPPALSHTTYSTNRVTVAGAVFRFSESMFEIPVQVLHVPEGMEIKTFPNTVRVLCKARLGRLKSLSPSDIKIIADYTAKRSDPQVLRVAIVEKPEDVYSVDILDDKVEFILRRK